MNLQSDNINELISALAKAQGRIVTAKKDKQNPFFKSSYADLSSVWDACRSALSDNGIAVIQAVQTHEGRMELVTTLAHASGQWMKSHMPVNPVKADPQSIGSALTYCRRYALSAMVGVSASEEDDDGNAANGRYDNSNNRKPSLKTEPIHKPKITKEQATELVDILGDCDQTYQAEVLKFVQTLGFKNLADVTEDVYVRIKSAALKKQEETDPAVGE